MSTELQNLVDAIAFIDEHSKLLMTGPLFPYHVMQMAKRHLNERISAYFTSDSEIAA